LFFAGRPPFKDIWEKRWQKSRLGGAVIITLEETMAMRRKEVWCCLFQIIFFFFLFPVSCFFLPFQFSVISVNVDGFTPRKTKRGSYEF
jgi:hypothetical protein